MTNEEWLEAHRKLSAREFLEEMAIVNWVNPDLPTPDLYFRLLDQDQKTRAWFDYQQYGCDTEEHF